MGRCRWFVVVAAVAIEVALPGQASAAPVPAQETVAATVTTTEFVAPGADFVEAFDGVGTGAGTRLSTGRPIVVQGNVAVTTFHMKVQAAFCCTVHGFVLGPWSGTWTVDGGNGDTLSGTATGVIAASCIGFDPTGFGCGGVAVLGPGVNFTLAITGGTGRYASASGTGSLSGEQTAQEVDVSPPPGSFAGTLTLSVT